MAQTPLERVLACPNLPSLPSVAMKVLELTRDPGTSISAIAHAVQSDPALSMRVLKTVNSSYYGLTVPCPSISRAMSLLGLNMVKSIVLGFSLVDMTRTASNGTGFDLQEYWRRVMYSATAARALAIQVRISDPEEAFVGALVQDVGMLACLAALRDDYLKVLEDSPECHDEIRHHEREVLGFDHASVGEQLAKRWRLPTQICECIGRHHTPDRASQGNLRLVRAVALANLMSTAMLHHEDAVRRTDMYSSAREWFELAPETVKELVQQARKGARELAKELDLSLGAPPDLTEILSQAHEQMLSAQEEVNREAAELRKNQEELVRKSQTDGLTGVYNRAYYDQTLRKAFDDARAQGGSVGVAFIDADKFKSVNDTHGHQAGDAVLMELARRLRAAVATIGTVCRYGGEEFGVIVPGGTMERMTKIGELLRRSVCAAPFDLRPYGVDLSALGVTISVGVSAYVPKLSPANLIPSQLTQAADHAVYAAKQAGRNCVRSATIGHVPEEESAHAPGATIMIVEDDPLAAKLLEVMFGRRRDVRVLTVPSAEEALAMLRRTPRPSAIVTDIRLKGMTGTEMIRQIRAEPSLASIPVIATSGALTPELSAQITEAGASATVEKSELGAKADEWLTRILAMAERSPALKAA